MTVNSKFEIIYKNYWDSLMKEGEKIINPCPTNPMVLSFDETAFSEADKKIVICGQETWGWDLFGTSIIQGMNTYQKFFIERNFYPGYGKSAFWKAFRFFEVELSKVFKGEKIQFIYQNISKIGRNDDETGVTDTIRSLEREKFPVFAEEMRILNPDIVIFLTGPDRDHDIRFHFPDAKFEQVADEPNLRRSAWVLSENLPAATIRLYHPSYFRAWTGKYRQRVVSLIKEACHVDE